LFRLASDEPLLAIVDEFPWLLGTTQAEAERTLSSIQAIMEEERDASHLKLVLCGSAVGQMEALQSERNPLHGRLVPIEVRPLDFARASLFLRDRDPRSRFERFAITGGMPRYLTAVTAPRLSDAVCRNILQPDAPLWNEGRAIVGQELREPAVHFALLEQLASGEKEMSELANALRLPAGTVSKYLGSLESLRLVSRRLPFGTRPAARGGHWALTDPFLRFWFRFVFPYQADLEAGLDPADLFGSEIAPVLADHIAPIFEEACRAHARRAFGATASRVGRWWGHALHALRRSGERSTEEIDIVGMGRNKLTLVGEAKWTTGPMGAGVLDDLEKYKLPALSQAGFKLDARPRIVLYAKSGFTTALTKRALHDKRIELVDATSVLSNRE
jgi:AAA+ ATPase superfamily predicted ATPase